MFRTGPPCSVAEIAPLVPSPVEGLTSVFGMGTGVAPLLWPPESDVPGLLNFLKGKSANFNLTHLEFEISNLKFQDLTG